ncbi:Mariner Mos1 transposase [Eumeta japonica]|uniref:Mariner Mos1 transposase n=1 Tax=Eumeta variegata TaxID=151549 RepID=A0A4C1YPA1_EUMVA|nr:Mariner Mos1 transposase [Eumeta japonica]
MGTTWPRINIYSKTEYSWKKLTLCIWLDQLGVVYYELLNPSETITGAPYRTQMMRLSRALKEKRLQYYSNGGNNAMMTTSTFGEGSGSGSPPYSPARAPRRVYASVAEMKRSRGKLWSKSLVGPGGAQLRRDFHSTPDLVAERCTAPLRTRSSEDVHGPGGRVPPPAHPPPPPPGAAPPSSFRPTDAAKLYAAPRDLEPVAYRTNTNHNNKHAVRKSSSLRSWSSSSSGGGGGAAGGVTSVTRTQSADEAAQYAQPFNSHKAFLRQNSTPAPPIPEPDYSMSESEDEGPAPRDPPPETSANSNASGSSSGSSSMQHSFSVDEIQKIRTRLKSSRSCGDELIARNGCGAEGAVGERDDADNSSSGVSSDQEAQARPPRRDKVSFCSSVTVKSSNDVISTEPVHSSSESIATSHSLNQPPPMQRHNSLTRKRATAALLRGTIGAARGRSAAERLGVDVDKAPGRRTRAAGVGGAAVSLVELPPPPEEPAAPDAPPPPPPLLAPPPQFSDRARVVAALPKRVAHLH